MPKTDLDLLRAVDCTKNNLGETPALKRPITDPTYHLPPPFDNRHTDVILVKHEPCDVLSRHLW